MFYTIFLLYIHLIVINLVQNKKINKTKLEYDGCTKLYIYITRLSDKIKMYWFPNKFLFN